MSVHTVERVLWEICCLPDRTAGFRTDPAGHLESYPVTDDERGMIQRFDVRGLADHGVSQMLLMMTWNVTVGPDKIGDYLARMNQPRSAARQ
jgi:hypothetical protein